MKKGILACVCLFLMALSLGCAERIYVQECPSLTLKQAEFMPRAYELKHNRVRVAITVSDKTKDIGNSANLNQVFRNAVEKNISEVGAEIVTLDGGQNRELIRLVETAQTGRRGRDKVAGSADYAIWTVLSAVDLDSEYKAPHKYDDGSVSDPQCRYSATVTGTLRIYDLSEEQIIDSINLHGSSSDSRDTTTSNCLITSKVTGLIREAAEDAISSNSSRLKNFFAPKGYISEKRVCKKKHLFKISLGKNFSLQKGLDVKIYTKYTIRDALSGEVRVEERVIAEGEVVEPIELNYAWVEVGDEERADKVKLGDYAKINFKPGILQRFFDMATSKMP